MSWTALLLVEGVTDASGTWAARDPDGALPPLIRRVLEREVPELRPEDLEFTTRPLKERLKEVKVRGSKSDTGLTPWGRKVLLALDTQRDAQLVIAVWDSDDVDERISDREAILDHLRGHGLSGAAVGVCIPYLEAWLVSDGAAFKVAFGKGPEEGLPGTPEAPARGVDLKVCLDRVLDALLDEEDAARPKAERFAKLAAAVDIETLERVCPSGFRRFREALHEFLAPCFALGGAS